MNLHRARPTGEGITVHWHDRDILLATFAESLPAGSTIYSYSEVPSDELARKVLASSGVHVLPGAAAGEHPITLYLKSGGRMELGASRVKLNPNRFNWICYGGIDNLIVREGRVFSTACSHTKELGAIDDYTLSCLPTRCRLPTCTSLDDATGHKHDSSRLYEPAFVKCEVPESLRDRLDELRQALVSRALGTADTDYGSGQGRARYQGSPFNTTKSILLRRHSNIKPYNWERQTRGILDDVECADAPEMDSFLEVREIVDDLMPLIIGRPLEEKGQLIFSKLPAGEIIDPHWDAGYYFEYYQRYHLVLRSNPECQFMIGTEQHNMQNNEIWKINNMITHFVNNAGGEDRYHLVMDLRFVAEKR